MAYDVWDFPLLLRCCALVSDRQLVSLLLRWYQIGSWSRGVTVSTLDSESSDRGSNPREAFLWLQP